MPAPWSWLCVRHTCFFTDTRNNQVNGLVLEVLPVTLVTDVATGPSMQVAVLALTHAYCGRAWRCAR